MRRVLRLLLAAAVTLALAWFVAELPGTISARIGDLTFETSSPVAAVLAGIGFVVLYTLVRALGGLRRLPRRMRARAAARRARLGEAASTRALVAIAAAEPDHARREAARARRLLGETAHTLLLAAEAGRLAGRQDETEAALTALTRRPDAAFLGYRGLLRQAADRQDWAEVATLARAAENAHPGAIWLRTERASLALRAGNWADALALADADAPKAALGAGAAEAETDPSRALRLARRAWKDDPALAPAALAYARRLRAAGRERKAQAVLRRSWALAPHPALAEFALAPVNEKLARVQAAQRLAEANPTNPETHLLLARTALDAGLTGEARRHAFAARDGGLIQRRLWLLLAAIEAAAGGDTDAGRAAQHAALQRAAVADADPEWRCTACHTQAATWQPACPACGAAGTLRWTAPQIAVLPPAPRA